MSQAAQDANHEPGEPGEEALAHEPVPARDAILEEETVDALAVLAEVRPIERPAPAPAPLIAAGQAAAAAATGFLAGAATFALVRRHSVRKHLARAQPSPGVGQRRLVEMGPGTGTRTYLVNVRLIARSGE